MGHVEMRGARSPAVAHRGFRLSRWRWWAVGKRDRLQDTDRQPICYLLTNLPDMSVTPKQFLRVRRNSNRTHGSNRLVGRSAATADELRRGRCRSRGNAFVSAVSWGFYVAASASKQATVARVSAAHASRQRLALTWLWNSPALSHLAASASSVKQLCILHLALYSSVLL
ncbi:hypothetical protein DFH11DRAFT_163798 [Phellopilus nigrolimitatus]|nr:hypothetical protein DFH11DRAFT_163798 [Phellopilus nigrolimitatus]